MSAFAQQGRRVLAQFALSAASRGLGPLAPGLLQAGNLSTSTSGVCSSSWTSSGFCSSSFSSSHSYHSAPSSGHQAITHATTILCLRKGADVVVIGDGQATQGDFIVKPNVTKVRRIGDKVIGGFAGRAADGLALLERLETKLEEHPGQLKRAAVELAKLWRQDKMLRELDASLLVADDQSTLWLMGNGDVVESADGIMGIGSGSDFAEAAARALMDLPNSNNMDIMTIAKKAMHIAADCCVYTNHNFMWHIIRNGSIESGSTNSSEDSKSGASANTTV